MTILEHASSLIKSKIKQNIYFDFKGFWGFGVLGFWGLALGLADLCQDKWTSCNGTLPSYHSDIIEKIIVEKRRKISNNRSRCLCETDMKNNVLK